MSGPSRGRPRHQRGRSHPAHLKGREIGLFYRQQNKQKRQAKPKATINVSPAKMRFIEQQILHETLWEKSEENELFHEQFHSIVKGKLEDKIGRHYVKMERDEELDEVLFKEWENYERNAGKMKETRENLPVWKLRQELLDGISCNQVVVISGETGCGKTTQIAQFILDDFIGKKQGSLCKIICTQPRRISAISVAERVAQERLENLGKSVGFSIRLERNIPRPKASITFCTTGVVLRQLERDPDFGTISHLIIDEIHERDVQSDFLLTIIKRIIRHRKDLKIILMSATLNSVAFSRYFNDAPHFNIPGFTYPVQEFFLEDILEWTQFEFPNAPKERALPIWVQKRNKIESKHNDFVQRIGPYLRHLESQKKFNKQTIKQLYNPQSEEINLELILELIKKICFGNSTKKGSILVFLTGLSQINDLNNLIEGSGRFARSEFLIIPLHSQLATVDQKLIFEPSNRRKIIISTNIAETSITINDVVYVIDAGRVKTVNYDPETRMETISPEWVSQASSHQRKGRAGRVQEGFCYHLFTRFRFDCLDKFQKPEILRKRLEDVILTAKLLQLGKINEFFNELIDKPSEETIEKSLELLHKINALDLEENLTPLGYHLARMPINAQIGKMLLLGAIFSCLNPILTIAATLDFKDPFQIPLGKEQESDQRRLYLSQNSKSDHLLYSQVLNLFEQSDNQRNFCWEFFLSHATLKQIQEMKKDLMKYLYEVNFIENLNVKHPQNNVNSSNFSLIKAIVAASLYPNVASILPKKRHTLVYSLEGQRMEFHPKSVLNKTEYFDSNLVVYCKKMKSTSVFLYDATMVFPLPLVFFGDGFRQSYDEGRSIIEISEGLRFRCEERTAEVVKKLRDKLMFLLEFKINHPGVVDWMVDSPQVKLLTAIKELITNEDRGDVYCDDDFD